MIGDSIRIVVTGLEWLGGGAGSIESALEELVSGAKEQIDLTAYSITNGANLLFTWIQVALDRGIKVRIIVNKKHTQYPASVSKLESLAGKYRHFELYYFNSDESDLHAKTIIADRNIALIGSSNLSRNGFLLNHEIAVYIKGSAAEDAATALDKLFNSKKVARFY